MKPLNLSIRLNDQDEQINVGELVQAGRDIYFEYDIDFLRREIPLSPFKLPLKAGVQCDTENTFQGLPGVFYDSLPDGWGLLLMDRYFRSQSIMPEKISPLERLAYMGERAMGALSYEPAKPLDYKWRHGIDLNKLAQDCQRILQGHEDDILPELIVAGGSPGGAKSKVLIGYNHTDKSICAGISVLPESYKHYLVKFSSLVDPDDSAQVELAYMNMAKACGIEVPETKLFEIKNYGHAFAMQRFDRDHNRKIHMHSLSGLLHANFRTSSLDYTDFIQATYLLTKSESDKLQAFRRMVFNIAFHNRDDHSKNFAYLFRDGKWHLSPAYDLTFSTGIAGEHTMTVAGEGANPSKEHILNVAQKVKISPEKTRNIIDEVQQVQANWLNFAKEAQVSSKKAKQLESIIGLLFSS